MTVTFRPAAGPDMPALGAIAAEADLFPPDLLGGMMAGFLEGSAPDLWIVAEGPGPVVGFAFCQPERLTEGTWNLLALAVRADRRGAGIGGALTRQVEERLRGAGARLLLVETLGTPDFARTRAFYRAQGFGEEARIRDFYMAGGDKVVFRKPLR